MYLFPFQKAKKKRAATATVTSSEATQNGKYRQISDIRRTLAGNKFADHSDVVGASPVGAAPTTSLFST